jgi:hypothetical protein
MWKGGGYFIWELAYTARTIRSIKKRYVCVCICDFKRGMYVCINIYVYAYFIWGLAYTARTIGSIKKRYVCM